MDDGHILPAPCLAIDEIAVAPGVLLSALGPKAVVGGGFRGSEPSADGVSGLACVQVAAEIAERYPDVLVAVAHRVGTLAIGDSALVCAIAAPHRKQA